ncbi:ribosomal protein L7Ae/L30e/S12e/Gadd45 [Tanacetum coccineum]
MEELQCRQFRGDKLRSQAKVIHCYNYQEEGHMARQCTKPKRPRNSTWFKEKAMLAEECVKQQRNLDTLFNHSIKLKRNLVMTIAQPPIGEDEEYAMAVRDFQEILQKTKDDSPFTRRMDLASLEYSRETEGPYCTDLPTPDDIRRLLELERVMVDRTIKSQTVSLNPNQILTKELSPDMKQWEELIRENVFGLGGHRDIFRLSTHDVLYYVYCRRTIQIVSYFFVKRIQCARYTLTANLPYGMFLTRLYRHVMETYPHLDNGIYDIVDRVMRPLALKQTRRPRSDRGKARHFVSSSSSHHQGTSSHQHDDDNDDDDNVQTSRASTPSPTTYLNSLDPLNYQNYQMPSASEQTDETLFER